MGKIESKYRMVHACKNCAYSDDVGVDELVLVCASLGGQTVEPDGVCREYADDDRKSW